MISFEISFLFSIAVVLAFGIVVLFLARLGVKKKKGSKTGVGLL